MRFKRAVRAAWIFGLLTAVPGMAGDSMNRLPGNMGVALSVRSAEEFVTAVDAAVAKSSRSLEERVGEGRIYGWFRNNASLLFDGGEEGVGVYCYLPPMMNHLAFFGHALVFKNLDFSEITRLLGREGVEFKEVKKGERISVFLGNSLPYIVENAGNGYVVAGFQPTTVRAIRKELDGGWRPMHWAEGVVSLAAQSPGAWLLNGVFLKRKLDDMREWLAHSNSAALDGIDREPLSRLLDAAEAAIPALRSEAERIDCLDVDVRLNGERLGVSLRVFAGPDSRLSRAGAAATARDNLDHPLLRAVDAGAVQLLAYAPFDQALPELSGDIRHRLAAVLEQAFPERKAEMLAAFDQYLESGSGVSVAATHYQDGRFDRTLWVEAQYPGDIAGAVVRFVKAMNGIYRDVFPGMEEDAVSVTDGANAYGIGFTRMTVDAGWLERQFALSNEMAAAMGGRSAAVTELPEWMLDFSSLLAVGDSHAVIVSGPSAEGRLARDLAAGPPAGGALLDRAAAQKALEELRHRQYGFVLTDYGFLTRFMVEGGMMGTIPGMRALAGGNAKEAFDRIEPSLLKTDSLVGLSVGGGEDCLAVDFVLPTDTINALIHNFVLLDRAGMSPNTAGGRTLRERGESAAIKANENTTITSLKQYAIAQVTFQIAGNGRSERNTGSGENGYADNFRNLFYGEKTGDDGSQPLAYIAREFADAFAGASGGVPAVPDSDPADAPAPYRGYLFLELPGVDFQRDFGLVAYPARFGETGTRIFAINGAGMVLEMDVGAREGGIPARGDMPPPLRDDETPENNPGLWKPVAE